MLIGEPKNTIICEKIKDEVWLTNSWLSQEIENGIYSIIDFNIWDPIFDRVCSLNHEIKHYYGHW